MCGAGPFKTIEELIAHAAVCGGPVFDYYCDLCGAGPFSSQAELDAHIATTHPPEPEYYCPYCGTGPFASQFALDQHIAIYHPPLTPYNYPVDVTVTNTSKKKGIPVTAILEITVQAILAGVEKIDWVSNEELNPGEAKIYSFNVYIPAESIGQRMVMDALIAAPNGGILDSDTKEVVV